MQLLAIAWFHHVTPVLNFPSCLLFDWIELQTSKGCLEATQEAFGEQKSSNTVACSFCKCSLSLYFLRNSFCLCFMFDIL